MRTTFSADCPYGCRDGKIYNPVMRNFVECPHCSKLRKKEVLEDKVEDGDNFCEKFNIRKSLIGTNFSMDAVLQKGRSKFTQESIDEVEEILQSLMNNATLGKEPDASYLIRLGSSCNSNGFLYPYISTCYKHCLDVAPVMSSLDVKQLRENPEAEANGVSYADLLSKDIVCCILDMGTTRTEFNAVLALAFMRNQRGKKTLILTLAVWHWNREHSDKMAVIDGLYPYKSAKTEDNIDTDYNILTSSLIIPKKVEIESKSNNVEKSRIKYTEPVEMSGDEFNDLFRTQNIL